MVNVKIVLYGVETNNKGAELMLYAILQEIERKWPNAEVYIHPKAIKQGLNYVQTKVKLYYWPISKIPLFDILSRIFRKLHLFFLMDTWAIKADYFIDGSGLRFSDNTKLWGTSPEYWDNLLKRQYKCGAKIVFLPQAFGPIELDITRKAIKNIGKYASVIMPRERVSYEYLCKSKLIDMNIVKQYPDFTSLVNGVFPQQYSHLRNGICIIPNRKMIEMKVISLDNYLSLLSSIILIAHSYHRVVYILNHEGEKDEKLSYMCQNEIGGGVEVVSGLNALEVKGLIATAHLVVSSRFHGLVSALNCCVPCLATSWSHKYEELFKEYGLSNCVLPIDDLTSVNDLFVEFLDDKKNDESRSVLSSKLPCQQELVKNMWKYIWDL